jgi:mono/diheme cytochrome c family protein
VAQTRTNASILALITVGVIGGALITTALLKAQNRPAQPPRPATAAAPAPAAAPDLRKFFDTYCVTCHDQELRTAGLALDTLDLTKPAQHAEVLEKVIGKLRAASMPPVGMPRPDPATYRVVYTALENQLDQAWTASPNPGRIGAVQRLNRAEYTNAIRDLFALDIDLKGLLPGDDTADGSFDNFADVLSISTAHLERYMSVARQVTRLATGLPPAKPNLETFEIPLHIIQEDRMSDDLPLGSRGGLAIHYDFPVDGEYLIKVRLQRQYQDYLKGMGWAQHLDIRLDGKLLKRFTVGGQAKGRPAATSYAGDGEVNFGGDPEWETYMQLTGDAGLEVRVPVQAGSRTVGVSFVRELWEPEGLPQPLQLGRVIANDQVYMNNANVASIQVGGPYQVTQQTVSADNTASRKAIFVCQSGAAPRAASAGADDRACAARILTRMARLAYRRPATKADVDTLLGFFDTGRQDGGSFDSGIQFALERMLVDPDFLLRVYRDRKTNGTAAYRLTDIELASRLSFFLWSSIPDDHLLSLAEKGELSKPRTLEQETRRMLADPRATDALVNNFAAQWLNLRQVDEVVVDPIKYPLYDDSLLQAFRTETEMFVSGNVREDRPVNELLSADYTFVNERLARHYGIPGIYGSRFRKVTLPNHDQRGGLLAQGALLVTTSYPDRTSPVLRGKWLLNNIFGLALPPPPPGVNATLETKPGTLPTTMRERLAKHRTEPTCNSCHVVIDPIGFSLENFDVIGGWRTIDEAGKPIDASGTTATGAKIDGLSGLRALLLAEPDRFPSTVTEKLMAYALGRRVEYYDHPAVRKIVRDAAAQQYRWSALIQGITQSPGFLMRSPQAAD